MEFKFDIGGMLKEKGLDEFNRNFRAKMLMTVRKSMQKIGKQTRDKIQADVRNKLNIKRNAFVKSFSYKVYFQRTGKIPSLHYYSRVPWVGIYLKGGKLTNTAIPLSKKKMGYAKMKKLFKILSSENNLFFDKTSKGTIAWAKNTEEHKRLLAPFRSNMRARAGKVIRKNERVNIAIVGKTIQIRKRLSMDTIAKNSITDVVRDIESNFRL